MGRTERLKLSYVVALAVILAAGAIWLTNSPGYLTFSMAVLAFMIPGRLQILIYRNLYAGLSEMRLHHYSNAIPKFEIFIEQLEQQTWLNHLLWWRWNIYTVSAAALAWNNIGASYIGLREFANAEKALDQAMSIDPLYPKPLFNKAVVALINGQDDKADAYLRQAEGLGFSGGGLEQARRMADSALANLLDDNEFPVTVSANDHERIADQLAAIQQLPADLLGNVSKVHHNSDYVLVALNDDSTPMVYLLVLLVKCFNFDVVTASNLVMQVHESGSAKTVGGELNALKAVSEFLQAMSEKNAMHVAFDIEKV